MQQISRLFKYLGPYKSNVYLNIFCNLFMALFTVVSIPAIIPFLQILFDEVPLIETAPASIDGIGDLITSAQYLISSWIINYGKEVALIRICVFIVILFFFKNLFRYLSLYFMAPVRTGIVRDLRSQLFAHLMYLPLSYHTEERKGDLMSRISSDVQEVEWSILNVLEALFREPVIILGCLLYMLYVSTTLTGFVFLLLLFIGFIIGGISKSLKKNSGLAQSRLGGLLSVLEEMISGLRIIKGFNAQPYLSQQFEKENENYRDLVTRILWRRDLSSPLSEFLGIAVVSVLLWFGARQVFNGELDAATFFSFLFAFFNIINPSKTFSTAYYNVQKGLAAVDRIDDLLVAKNNIANKPSSERISGFSESLRLQGVHFSYTNSEENVLDNINLDIQQGKIIGLVGTSGSGKSTLADLLLRFYDPTKGAIYIDGKDIRDINIDSLRNLYSIVSQEPILFNDTIYNNIIFGDTSYTQTQVESAAKTANAHDFILASDNGYQTLIGDRGSKLSGGQRQRLTLARAILRNPSILILDEATSSLDTKSEKQVQLALEKMLRNRTAIIIAHRLSTIRFCDEIIVLEDGRIVEQGTHEELLKMNNAYCKLIGIQTP